MARRSASFPRYSYPGRAAAGFLFDLFLQRRRSFQRDAQACLARLVPPLRLLGAEYVPQAGPALIVFNHYYRPGFNAWWLALAISAVVPQEIHFAMTGELTFPGKWYAPLGQSASRWLLRRLANLYGFTTMPPMPPRPKDVEARAAAVMKFLAFARSHPQAILALAPEGGDNPPSGALARPPSGVGRFLLHLSGSGFPLVPVGAWEENGAFHLHFGPAYRLEILPRLDAEERDRLAAEMVMRTIAALLPSTLRGEFKAT
ncbi:MAG: 1-acyl-sn-glycerol-3-phosphate acyltransferase [Anaerolineales bacterium]|nr:1-acyl-sn-glycerol-3-phosphate acyltransferase [Anaerolineales bacterium]MCX7608649.1 1-acyl-sn-glycerol-3-phosphate acyltransferase [Anaerolineales bacterium]MDW8228108.1 1-acyl-sn-glycerol-3-phosphate acyltransferase [Anaerolineales bacterium]